MTNTKKLGFFIIFLGVLFCFETFSGYSILTKFWPLFISSMATGFIGIFYKRKKREPVFLGIGVYIGCFSILALICNFLSWSLLQVLWPLFFGFFGVSFLSIFIFSTRHKIYIMIALFFIALSTVFLLVFSVSYKFWWIIFFFLAAVIFISGSKHR